MTAPDDARRVADALTKAQRALILGARETPLMARMKMQGRSKSLCARGVAVRAWKGGDFLAPLGLAVLAILEAEDVRR